ncbi:MAG: YcgN family cysteine cluster protein [Marinomonadaceae bacterium]
MAKRYEPFWKTTAMDQMSAPEWESLCDGCGKCCLQKLEDEDSADVYYTNLACEQLDVSACQCKVYDTRQSKVASCITLTPDQIQTFDWLPDTCGYRVLHETGELPNWHPLVVGSNKEMIRQGLSVRDYAVPETRVDEEDWETHIIKWVHGLPEPYDFGEC